MVNVMENKETTAKGLLISLWAAQMIVALGFVQFGFMKLAMPVAELAKIMLWADDTPLWFVRMIGLVDIAGGIGILLPALTRIRPGLTVVAAAGCALLQVCAIIFHLSRGEGAMVPMNLVLLVLALFVFWGRRGRAAVTPR